MSRSVLSEGLSGCLTAFLQRVLWGRLHDDLSCRRARLRRGASRRLLRTLLASAGMLLLAACSPTFDWRESNELGAAVLFPAKPTQVARNLDLEGVTVAMTMQSARAGTLTFALARVDLPAGSDVATVRPKVEAALLAALARNVNGTVTAQAGANVARATRGAPGVPAASLSVTGQSAGQAVTLQARVAGDGARVWQIAAYGAAEAMAKPVARDAVDTFLLSLRLQ